MARTFFDELNRENLTGVAYKNIHLKKATLAYFANTGNATIADMCKELNLSTPKVTALLNDLIRDGLVKDYGKIQSTGGRKPNLYGLVPDSAFFIGVDVKQDHLNLGLSDLHKNLVSTVEALPYELDNTRESLDQLCNLINQFIVELTVPKSKILGIGINISGRINYSTGFNYSVFNFEGKPLNKLIEAQVGIRVFVENDSRAMAYGEFCSDVVNGEKNVLFLNMDYGIGMGVVINGELYYGKSGYSGEFGHIPLFDNDIICHCGKRGCLETEASGWALVRMARQKLAAGASSVMARIHASAGEIQLQDIIQAANHDDMLAIELIAQVGENLGRGVALLINIFNPELVILGGSLAASQDHIRLPIKSAMKKYSQSLVSNDTQLKMSKLGERAGIIGACLLVRNKVLIN
ncbi:ROK family protein [Chitinophaga nivalis]|uniref:ROK family protein n=1 Tax=Chitinophaga nivalis TaxID=2991709 RepID=A0ABT3IWU7_9BACT|nr:ROK family transcriptional regulator [Chitinophaga nivalis]MCW3461864.1 ROK family protein [Chitinophaga nivalis]MCW3488445.1 ROK family protein [Chitinophaga nivalis]